MMCLCYKKPKQLIKVEKYGPFWACRVHLCLLFLSAEKPTVVRDGYLLCPAVRLEEVGQ